MRPLPRRIGKPRYTSYMEVKEVFATNHGSQLYSTLRQNPQYRLLDMKTQDDPATQPLPYLNANKKDLKG